MEKVITIAGSDSTGGGGIQADLKTFEEYGVFGFSSITSIVTMDPQADWSHQVTELSEELVRKQLVSAFASGKIVALKTGMMGNEKNIQVASQFIQKYKVPHVVIDPVIACKGTAKILQPKSVEGIKKQLLPFAEMTTPNLVEAGILSGLGELTSIEAMQQAAKNIHALGPKYVVIKGGHRLPTEEAIDLLYDGEEFLLLRGPKIATEYNHGAGCTFAAAITAGLAKGYSVKAAVVLAKEFVVEAIKQGIYMNQYVGHVWHGAYNQAEKRMELKK